MQTLLSLVAVGALALLGGSAQAQRPDSLPIGTRISVRAAGEQLTGFLREADAESMLFKPHGRSARRLRYTEITSVHIARDRASRQGGAASGALRGMLVGASVGVIATSIAYHHDVNSSAAYTIPTSVIIGAASVGLTIVTTTVGALIGSQRTAWEQVWPR